jgi:flagellar biosynthesis anti-sigma factor FlgM
MRIDSLFGFPVDPESSRVGGAANNAASSQVTPSSSGDNQDGASISTTAQKLAQFSAGLANTPDIRQERVSQLADSIQSGTYSVSNRQIAESIYNDMQNAGGSMDSLTAG